MSKTWVKTDYVPETSKDYITEDKWYEVVKYDYRSGSILDDEQRYIFILFKGCAFLHNRSWTVYEGDTPPTEETKPMKDFSKGDIEIVKRTQQTEWRIRHIKSDDYKSGRDVAITILYKEIGEGYYEYKFAICSPKDMFSRKKGVEEALKKGSDKLYNEGSVPFTGLVLMHMSISNKFSKDTRSLILSKMVELG